MIEDYVLIYMVAYNLRVTLDSGHCQFLSFLQSIPGNQTEQSHNNVTAIQQFTNQGTSSKNLTVSYQ